MSSTAFRDRKDAGQLLGGKLAGRGYAQPVVLALSAGGAVVARAVATALAARLDPILVRRLASPERPEATLGHVVQGEPAAVDAEELARLGIGPRELERLVRIEEDQVARQALRFRDGGGAVDLAGRTAILVDDGSAPLDTLHAALASARVKHAKRVLVALPAATLETRQAIASAAEVVCLLTTTGPDGTREAFAKFDEVSEEEAAALFEASGDR